jgi:uncharacterized protein (DUF1800 family)
MRRYSLAVALCMVLLAPVLLLGRKHKPPAADEQKRALHALNRLTFGPQPGDVQRVFAMGVDKWIELQLHPEKIDDGGLAARLEPLRTLRMSPREMVENFPPPPLIKTVAAGREPLPSDPQERAIYQAQLQRYQQKQERRQAALQPANSDSGANGNTSEDERAQRRQERLNAQVDAESILALPPPQRMAAILRLPADEQQALLRSLSVDERESLLSGLDPRQRETVMALQNPALVVTQELMAGRLLRDIYSQRQLQEVMTDFWLNHFNVFAGKGADRYLLTSYERDVIRPHALGKFKDLLVATAQSPAMLFYLDNWLSVGPDSDVARGVPVRRNPRLRPRARMGPFGPRIGMGMPLPPRPRRSAKQNKKRSSGLNENYARELMELHTLSVNGGYSQQDVIAVARVFTGWTIQQPFRGGGFFFNERMHEPGDKMVLGHRIKQGGEEEGLKVLDLLARSPATATFICTKLAQRFVSDNPPPALVARMQSTFLKKDGDIREVLRVMFRSPEFWAPQTYRAKVKTPLEFVASAVRATSAEVSDPQPLLQFLNRMGEPLYGCQPPNGYSMMAEEWVNSSALLNRMNFALALATGHLPGLEVSTQQLLGTPDLAPDAHLVLAQLENHMLDGDVSQQTHDTVSRQLDDPRITQRRLDDPPRPPNVGVIAGLLLGSPEFQRR